MLRLFYRLDYFITRVTMPITLEDVFSVPDQLHHLTLWFKLLYVAQPIGEGYQ